MIYNFDEKIERKGTNSLKFDAVSEFFHKDDIIPLWVADMDFKTAKPIIDACVKKAKEGVFGYTLRYDSYFESLCMWQKKRNGWTVDKNLISWSFGVVASLSAIVRLFTKKDDSVLILTPVYPKFFTVPLSLERKVEESMLIERDGIWEIDFDDFEKKAKNSKLFILCNPHNPLGRVWTKDELSKMMQICLENDVLVVSDEIHSDIIFHGKKHCAAANISEKYSKNIITCTSCTKTFNLAGIQGSAVIFPDMEKKKKFDRFFDNLDINSSNSFSVVAMEAAYRYGEDWLEQMLSYVDKNFEFIKDYCERYIPLIKPNIPDATYLVWLDCRGLKMTDSELDRFFVNEASLALNPGYTFCGKLNGFMRLNAACPRSTLKKAMENLRYAVESLKF